MDNLNEVAKARELINILWDIQSNFRKDEQDWDRVEILLDCYEQKRDKYLEAALTDLEDLRQIVTR